MEVRRRAVPQTRLGNPSGIWVGEERLRELAEAFGFFDWNDVVGIRFAESVAKEEDQTDRECHHQRENHQHEARPTSEGICHHS